jgi:vacuolar-type H+-ATPase subunit F/Vma7
MSRLLVLTRPALVAGFQMAGVETFGVEDAETARELIEQWLEDSEVNLLAIDDGILSYLDPAFVKRMKSSERLPYLAIPGMQPLGLEISRKQRIVQIIRQAIGFHITFKGEEAEAENE